MTAAQFRTIHAALENAGKILSDAAKALEAHKDDRPPMPAPESWWSSTGRKWITVKDVYGHSLAELEPPPGKLAGFRPPKSGEKFAPYGSPGLSEIACYDFSDLCPRLILEDAPKRKRLVLEEARLGEVVHFQHGGVFYRIVEEQ